MFSRTLRGQTASVTFVHQDIAHFTASLKETFGKDIWVVGGAEVITPLLRENLVDDFIIHIALTIIGQGIPLLKSSRHEMTLDLVKVTQHEPFVELHYKRK